MHSVLDIYVSNISSYQSMVYDFSRFLLANEKKVRHTENIGCCNTLFPFKWISLDFPPLE